MKDSSRVKDWVDELEKAMNESYPIKTQSDTEAIEHKASEIVQKDLSGYTYPYYELGNAASEAYESSNLSNVKHTVQASIIRIFEWKENESMSNPHGDWNYFCDGWSQYNEEN